MAITLNSSTKQISLTIGVYDNDALTFSRTTETLDVEYNDSCFDFGLYLSWLNSLGGWEYWLFRGEKDYEIGIEEDIVSAKNLFNSWDTDFINEDTEYFYSSIEAYEQKEIRSNPITKEQADAIAKIKHSIQVQQLEDDNSKKTVLVDKGNIVIRRDGDFFGELSFTIRETNPIPIQEQ